MKYTVSEAGKKLPRLLKEACAGREVVITAGKDLQVKLIPIRVMEKPRTDRMPGRLKGKIFYTWDAFDHLKDKGLSDLGSKS